MAQIGTFTQQDEGYTGTIRTLTLNAKVKLVPVDKDNDKAPDYRLLAGTYELGAACNKISNNDRPYLSVTIDDPTVWTRPFTVRPCAELRSSMIHASPARSIRACLRNDSSSSCVSDRYWSGSTVAGTPSG